LVQAAPGKPRARSTYDVRASRTRPFPLPSEDVRFRGRRRDTFRLHPKVPVSVAAVAMISTVARRFRFLSPRGVIFPHFVLRRGSGRSQAQPLPPLPEGVGFRCRRARSPVLLSEDAWTFLRRLRSLLPLSEDAGRFGRSRGLACPCPKTRTFLAAGTRRLAPDRSRDRRTSRASTGCDRGRSLALRRHRGPGSADLVPNTGMRPSVISVRGRMTPSVEAPKRFRRGPRPRTESDTMAVAAVLSEDAAAPARLRSGDRCRPWLPREAAWVHCVADPAGLRRGLPGWVVRRRPVRFRSGRGRSGTAPLAQRRGDAPLVVLRMRTLPCRRPKAMVWTGSPRRSFRARPVRRSSPCGLRPRRNEGRSARLDLAGPPLRVPEGARSGGGPKTAVRVGRRGVRCVLFPRRVRGILLDLAGWPASSAGRGWVPSRGGSGLTRPKAHQCPRLPRRSARQVRPYVVYGRYQRNWLRRACAS